MEVLKTFEILDISNNIALTHLYCSGNQLTALDVSNNNHLVILYCSPMNDPSTEANLLKYLYIKEGQSINGITQSRSSSYIPVDTQIIPRGKPGENDDYDEGGEG